MTTARHLLSVLIVILGMLSCIALCTEQGSLEGVTEDNTGVTLTPTPFITAKVRTGQNLPSPPTEPVRLLFIHHSCGENWLADGNGGLGIALRDNNYVVSDTNYGWGPDIEGTPLGDLTDIGHWWIWFRAPRSAEFLDQVYAENSHHAEYSWLEGIPGGENEIIMFKSCFPNSNLQGSPDDPVPSIGANPLRGESSGSEYHAVSNAKGIYRDLLEYFRTRPDKLFIVVTAPPVSDPTYASNTRIFNEWLVNDWLDGYPYRNVFVFDLYNILTSNGGNAYTNDLNRESGNHHRWWQGSIQHQVQGSQDTTAYASDREDDHPTEAGNKKATAEFLPLLNNVYQEWKSAG